MALARWLLGPLLVFILVSDAVMPNPSRHLLAAGALDETAHAATALLFLAALMPMASAGFIRWAVIGSVAIDIDHLPQSVLHAEVITAGTGRPYSHSLLFLAAIVMSAVAASRRGPTRIALLGIAFGVATHLWRDMNGHPGVPLWWPVSKMAVTVPYWCYAAVLVGCAVEAMRQHARPPGAVLARALTAGEADD
jgi:inner membrane protein